MKWKKFEYQGEEYDLTHLNSFEWRLEQEKKGKYPAKKYRFNIEFSMHCFTKELLIDESLQDHALLYKGPKEKRVFCFDRYELSRQLPEIIETIEKRTCWHTHHGSFFTIEIQDKNGEKKEYEIYFDVYKSAKGWLTLIVKSAYVRDEHHGTTQPRKRKIRFSIIARTRMENKKLRPPQ